MTDSTTDAAQSEGKELPATSHYIDHTVKIYLRLADDGSRWVLDFGSDADSPDAMDRPAPEDLEGPRNELCGCPNGWESCVVALEQAEQVPLPTYRQLQALLNDEAAARLGFTSPARGASDTDPDATLSEFRAQLQLVEDECEAFYANPDNEGDGTATGKHADSVAALYERAATLAAGLFEHLAAGGPFPKAWIHPRAGEDGSK